MQACNQESAGGANPPLKVFAHSGKSCWT